jgi:GxxExxY protein
MNDPLTEQIIAAAIKVHRILGPGLLESICEEAFCHELVLRSLLIERQKEVDVIYKDKIIKGQRLDLVVNQEVVVEIKSLRKRTMFLQLNCCRTSNAPDLSVVY